MTPRVTKPSSRDRRRNKFFDSGPESLAEQDVSDFLFALYNRTSGVERRSGIHEVKKTLHKSRWSHS